MTLAASEQGLGTCWVCKFDSAKCHDILKLPNQIEVIALLPLGYPAGEPDKEKHLKRKSGDEVVHWDSYKKPD